MGLNIQNFEAALKGSQAQLKVEQVTLRDSIDSNSEYQEKPKPSARRINLKRNSMANRVEGAGGGFHLLEGSSAPKQYPRDSIDDTTHTGDEAMPSNTSMKATLNNKPFLAAVKQNRHQTSKKAFRLKGQLASLPHKTVRETAGEHFNVAFPARGLVLNDENL